MTMEAASVSIPGSQRQRQRVNDCYEDSSTSTQRKKDKMSELESWVSIHMVSEHIALTGQENCKESGGWGAYSSFHFFLDHV
jgi:hypothetical protein